MIEIEGGITIDGGVTIGDVSITGNPFVTEDGLFYLVSETDDQFIEE